MKIRTVPKDDRSSIRQCEDCKESGKEGVFLTLGFFNGFVCTDCGWLLDEALRTELFELPHLNMPEAPNIPAVATGVIESMFATDGKQVPNIPSIPRMPPPPPIRPDPGMSTKGRKPAPTNLVAEGTTFSVPSPQPDAPRSAPEAPGAIFPEETTQTLGSRIGRLESDVASLWKQIDLIQAGGRNRGILGGLPTEVLK